jgi:DNA integrity scanning protein DisA with diadenylate cyclase activity
MPIFNNMQDDISDEPKIGFSMRQVQNAPSVLRLITAVVCIIILVLPTAVSAETLAGPVSIPLVTTTIVPNSTVIPTTPVPYVFLVVGNGTAAVNPPPLIIFDTPIIENQNCTIYGIVEPGSLNVSIEDLRWDWGDGLTPEFHRFPNSHLFSNNGTYTVSITAMQSDGQIVIESTEVTVGQSVTPTSTPSSLEISLPGAPGEPVLIAHAPDLTLLEPVKDGMNVTLNGILNTESPGVSIASVNADWGDGNVTKSADFPLAHQYSGPGIFTISVTGSQTDGQSTTHKIILDLKEKIPDVSKPPASGSPPNDPPVYLIILVTAIVVVAIGVTVLRVTQPKTGSISAPDSRKAFPARTGPLSKNLPSRKQLGTICSGTDVIPVVLDSVLKVAFEIAREGREGKAMGTSFVIGDSKNVLTYSHQFVLNPFQGHPESDRQITDVRSWGNIKEFAQLDGAFLITGSGVVEAAGRCITVDMSKVNLPGGLGSRHSSIAAITQVTRSIGIVVSKSGGTISIFKGGNIVYAIRS